MYSHKLRVRLFILPILLLVTAFSARAQITGLHFTGKAVYRIGSTATAISGIHVDLIGNNSAVLGSATTDTDGNFEIVLPLESCTPTASFRVDLTSPTWSFQGSSTMNGCNGPGIYSFGNLTMIRVLSVLIEDAYSGQTSTNPNAGAGLRIYPDKQTPTDAIDRRKINIRVYSTFTDAVTTVYYKIFDLDDPSDNVAPIDSNGSLGDDNRATNSIPAVNLLQSIQENPGASALIEFTTTMQPGDNFAIVASTKSDYINGITVDGTNLKDAGGNIITLDTGSPEAAIRTQMLTVWRRFHIEIDSMGQAQNNFVTGIVSNGVVITRGRSATLSVTPVNLEVDRFENGRLEISSIPYSLKVNSNTANSVDVTNTGNVTVSISSGAAFNLYDDDDFNNNNGNTLDGDTGEDIPAPDTSLVTGSDNPATNVFAPAYITPVYDIGDNNSNVTFVANILTPGGQGVRNLFDFDQIATEASTNFWTGYLLGSYQDLVDEDEDPETEQATLGATDMQNGQGSVVHMETNGPKDCHEATIACNIAATTGHELGHLFNADHGDGGIMDDLSLSFSAASIAKIRTVTHP